MQILTEMECHDKNVFPDSLIDLAIRLDNALRKRPLYEHTPQSEPMQRSPTKLITVKQEMRSCNQHCYYWKAQSYRTPLFLMMKGVTAPVETEGTQKNFTLRHTVRVLISHQGLTMKVQIRHSENVYVLTALLDSRSAGNLIDQNTVLQLKIPMQTLQSFFSKGAVTHCTMPPPSQCPPPGVNSLLVTTG